MINRSPIAKSIRNHGFNEVLIDPNITESILKNFLVINDKQKSDQQDIFVYHNRTQTFLRSTLTRIKKEEINLNDKILKLYFRYDNIPNNDNYYNNNNNIGAFMDYDIFIIFPSAQIQLKDPYLGRKASRDAVAPPVALAAPVIAPTVALAPPVIAPVVGPVVVAPVATKTIW